LGFVPGESSSEQWQVTRRIDAILHACLTVVATAHVGSRPARPLSTSDIEDADAALVHLDELIAERRRQQAAALPAGRRDAMATLDELIANRRHTPERDAPVWDPAPTELRRGALPPKKSPRPLSSAG
jgi:hypothetical protein